MPVPLPVVIVRVEGPFTALDRKLWLLLVHNAWDELDSDKPYHEISVAELLRLFRNFGRTDLGARAAKHRTETGEGYEPTDMVWEKLHEVAPGWDKQVLLARFREWSKGKEAAKNPHGAFINWAKSFTKGKHPSSGALDLRGEREVIKLEPSARVTAKRIEWQDGGESGLSREQLRVMRGVFPGVDIREMEKRFVAWKEAKGGAGVSAENYCSALNEFIRKTLKRKAAAVG